MKFQYIITHLILFFYIYPIKFNFIPISSRVFISILGLITLFFIYCNCYNFRLHKSQLYKIIIPAFIFTWSILAIYYNETYDFEFIKYPFSILLIFFASNFTSRLIKTSNSDFRLLTSKLIINVVLFQVLIALLMFLIPSFGESLNSIIDYSKDDLIKINEALEFRLVGFGSRFFGSGIVNGFALILVTFIISEYSLKKSLIVRYTIVYIIIFVFGMMMARTTIIGAFLSLILLVFKKHNLNEFSKKIIFIKYLIFIPISFFFIIYFFFSKEIETIINALEFGFELFINYFKEGSFETKSSNILKEMIIFPEELKTYLIGDGYYIDPITKNYYKSTDIGYLRIVYYFGIPGLILFFSFQYFVIKEAFRYNSKSKIFFQIVFAYLLILNLKGFTDLIFISALFFHLQKTH